MQAHPTNQPIPVKITSQALIQIKAIMQEKGISTDTYGLRIGIRGGGCNGASFLLGFDNARPSDEFHILEGMPIYIEKRHIMYLLGLEIDYQQSEYESGFVFNNPIENPALDN